ncbi:MAG TPA: MlaD family protein [Edaphocola sp.]|nr:MlaD family protein [Edaphocola sp.]
MSVKAGKEWKIGLVVVIAVLLFIFGLNFLMGKKIFSSEDQFYTYYSNVQGLQESAAVQVSGMTVGRVSGIELQPDRRVKVTFTTNDDLKIPKGSFAKLAAADLISGTKIITLEFSDSNQYYPDGAMIPPHNFSGLLDNISENVSPLLTSVQHAVVTLDTLISSVNSLFNTETQKHLSNSLASLDQSLAQLAILSKSLNEQSRDLAAVLQNVNSITTNLAGNNENISHTLSNLNDFSSELAASDVQKTMQSLQEASANLKGITEKINTNQGSLGLMLNDKQLYNNLTQTLSSMDVLLDDLKAHPAKYINVSVFGRKAR